MIENWISCTEESYPLDSFNSPLDRVVVRYWISGEGPYYSFYQDCPYGWGTLCKMERSEYYILPE